MRGIKVLFEIFLYSVSFFICSNVSHDLVNKKVPFSIQHKQRNLVWTSGKDALDGELQSSSEVDFYIDKVGF